MKKFYAIILFIFFMPFIWAQDPQTIKNPIYQNNLNNQEDFNTLEANKVFDQINLKLSTQNLNLKDLQIAIKKLQNLNNEAQDCVENTQKRLNYISNLLSPPSLPGETKTTALIPLDTTTADQVYLQKESKRLSNAQAQCRLFTIRADEAITAYQSAAAELKKEETFSQTLPIWKGIPKFIKNFNHHNLIQNKLSFDLSQIQWPIFAYTLLLSIFFAIYIYWYFSRVPRFKKIFRLKGEHLEWVVSLFFANWMLLNWVWCIFHPTIPTELCEFFKILSIYIGLIFLNHFIFSIKRVRALFYWYGLDFKYFDTLITIIIFILFARALGPWIKPLLNPNRTAIIATQTLLLIIILGLTLFNVYRFIRKHRHFSWINNHRKALKNTSILFTLTCIVCDMIGYHVLAMRLVYSGLTIIFIAFMTGLFVQAAQKIYLNAITPPQNSKIRYLFGYKEHGNYTELLILKFSLQIIIIALGLFLIGQSLGFLSFYVDLLYAPLLNGIIFSNFTIYPARILIGAIIFCLLFLACRMMSTAIARFYQFEEEEDTQVAVASILNYIGFALALIAGLLTAGFNFTGLAIVAGALSVGIGLGLQSIVNNFVSGLILLIEKPIKPGDRINVDGVEGTVKKIRVRSTQIITPQREDIIVPNSDLVTRRVTNYMYTDKYLSIFSQVHVAYESDIQLVNDLLLQAAYSHDDIIKTGRQKPNVLFKGFGDHALMFQLWCLIRDANKKSVISSDLNYSIFKLFNEHGVVMPMPQQTVFVQNIHDKNE
ncbi:MAG TPA: portal protein [Legionellales bacterium]|nr:portal protein [Legionellales bacterium]